MARVLVLNAGSSSLKWVVLDAAAETVADQGALSWLGAHGGAHQDEVDGALRGIRDVAAVGHRVVHGGSRFVESVRLDDGVRDAILELKSLAPLHNPSAVAGIDAARRAFPDVPQVAAFDTAFHNTLPQAAATYPVPWVWTERWGLRRFGFHGLSVRYAVRRAGEMAPGHTGKVVVCHLGAGCSITAVEDGRSVDTSMGFTPLEGVMMVQRSGSIDPGMMLYLLQRMSAQDMERDLNERSGLLGVSGVSADLREVTAEADKGNARAALALDMFCHRVVACVGGMSAVLGGLDALVFTGGIGEHSALMRSRVVAALRFLGVDVDEAANSGAAGDADISVAGARVRTLVVAAREDLTILEDVKRLVRL